MTPDSTRRAPYTPPPRERTPVSRFFDAIRSLGIVRTSDRIIGGVAAGFAHKIGISPLAMRLILVVLVFCFGLSLWAYLIAWVLLPNDRDGSIPLQRLIS